MKCTFWFWDSLRNEMDIGDLNDAMFSVFDGKNCPCIYKVENDQLVSLVVSSERITQEQAQTEFDKYMEER